MLSAARAFARTSSSCVSAASSTVRFVSTSSWLRVRELRSEEAPPEAGFKTKTHVVEGVPLESPRKPFLVKVADVAVGKEKCHPFCQLPFVHEVKHTDVLILEQFLTRDGKVMDRDVTGLCRRQHKRVEKLIRMAQKAGLMPPERDQYREEKLDKKETPWATNHTYWDEKTIDIQWLEVERVSRKAAFKK